MQSMAFSNANIISFTAIFGYTRALECLVKLLNIMRQLAEFSRDSQHHTYPHREFTLLGIEVQLREWSLDELTRQYAYSQWRSVGVNYSTSNEQGFMDPAPWEIPYLDLLYLVLLLRIQKERLAKNTIPDNITFSTAKLALMRISTLLEKIMGSCQDLTFLPPFVGLCVYEVLLYPCHINFIERNVL
jgi:hypothetical protein